MPRQTVPCPNGGLCGSPSHYEGDGSGQLERCRSAAWSKAVRNRTDRRRGAERTATQAAQRAAVGLPPSAIEPAQVEDSSLLEGIQVEYDSTSRGTVVWLEGQNEAIGLGRDQGGLGYGSTIGAEGQRGPSLEREVFLDSNGDPWVRLGVATDAPLSSYLVAGGGSSARLPLGISPEEADQAREELEILARFAYSPEGDDFIDAHARRREPMLGTHREHFEIRPTTITYSNTVADLLLRGKTVTHYDAVDLRTGSTVMFAYGTPGELELAIAERVTRENDTSLEDLLEEMHASSQEEQVRYSETVREIVSDLGDQPLRARQSVALRTDRGVEMARIDAVSAEGQVTGVIVGRDADRPFRLTRDQAERAVVRSVDDVPADPQR